MLLLQTRARRARLIVRGGRQHHNGARRPDERLRSASYWRPTTVSASRTFPQLLLLTPVFARDAAGDRQLVRLGHYLNPPDGFVMAAAPQRAGSLVVSSPRALGGGERSGSWAASTALECRPCVVQRCGRAICVEPAAARGSFLERSKSSRARIRQAAQHTEHQHDHHVSQRHHAPRPARSR